MLTKKILRLKEVMELTCLARSTIYKYMKEGKFPKQIMLGGNNVAWVYKDVVGWVDDRIVGNDKDYSDMQPESIAEAIKPRKENGYFGVCLLSDSTLNSTPIRLKID